MPTYDYECILHGIIEMQLPVGHKEALCPTCQQEMKRIYTAVPIQFKGTGFYKTGG